MDGFQHTMQYYFNNYPLEVFCVKPFKEVKLVENRCTTNEKERVHGSE